MHSEMQSLSVNLPFYFLDEVEFTLYISDAQTNDFESFRPNLVSIDHADQLLFDQFNIDQQSDQNNDIDIDFYSGFSDRVNSCKYFFSDGYENVKCNLKSNTLSVCCWNANSIPKNLEKFATQVN